MAIFLKDHSGDRTIKVHDLPAFWVANPGARLTLLYSEEGREHEVLEALKSHNERPRKSQKLDEQAGEIQTRPNDPV